MPRYDYKCPVCQHQEEKKHSVEMCDAIHVCRCGARMNRMISLGTMVIGDFEPYLDENMGPSPVYVKSKQHRKQLLRERGLTDIYGVGS